MHPIIQAEVDEFRKEFKISNSSGEDFGPLMIEVKSVEQFLSAALHRAVERAGKEERQRIKKIIKDAKITKLGLNKNMPDETFQDRVSINREITIHNNALSKLDTIINFKE